MTWFVVSATVPVTELEPVCATAEATIVTAIASVDQTVFSIFPNPFWLGASPMVRIMKRQMPEMHRMLSADHAEVNRKVARSRFLYRFSERTELRRRPTV
jgi:hypothetical protein